MSRYSQGDSEDQLVAECGGIRRTSTRKTNYSNQDYEYIQFFKTGDIVVPDNVYIRIDSTATKGTIGKLVNIEFGYCSAEGEVHTHMMTYIIQVDGRKGTNRIVRYHATILENHNGTTKFVRNVKKHNNEAIPVIINKYNQPLLEGEWVVGLGMGKSLYFGVIVRWSKSSVWVNPTPSVKGSKNNCINRPHESFILPDGPDYEQMVTMMAMKGWTGYG